MAVITGLKIRSEQSGELADAADPTKTTISDIASALRDLDDPWRPDKTLLAHLVGVTAKRCTVRELVTILHLLMRFGRGLRTSVGKDLYANIFDKLSDPLDFVLVAKFGAREFGKTTPMKYELLNKARNYVSYEQFLEMFDRLYRPTKESKS